MKTHLNRSKKNIVDSYNQLFSETNKLIEMPSYYNWVLKHLKTDPNDNLLDIATGTGELLKSAEKKNIRTTGIDISISAINRATSETNKSYLLLCDGEALPFKDKSYNFITNLGSLEHFINPKNGIKEMKRVLNDDGVAAIFLPNSYYIIDIFRIVLMKGYGPSHGQVLERFATKNEWADFLEENGLFVKKIIKYNFLFPRSLEDWKYIIKKPKKIIASLLSPFIPLNLSYSFLYLCKKRTIND